MGKKNNTDFLAAYIELDTACAELLGVKRGGITEYINELKEAKGAPQGSETLSKLISYRKARNKLAHEEGALSDVKDIDKTDVRWIDRFKKTIQKRRDPLSLYKRPAKAFTVKAVVAAAAALAAVIAVIAVAVIILK